MKHERIGKLIFAESQARPVAEDVSFIRRNVQVVQSVRNRENRKPFLCRVFDFEVDTERDACVSMIRFFQSYKTKRMQFICKVKARHWAIVSACSVSQRTGFAVVDFSGNNEPPSALLEMIEETRPDARIKWCHRSRELPCVYDRGAVLRTAMALNDGMDIRTGPFECFGSDSGRHRDAFFGLLKRPSSGDLREAVTPCLSRSPISK